MTVFPNPEKNYIDKIHIIENILGKNLCNDKRMVFKGEWMEVSALSMGSKIRLFYCQLLQSDEHHVACQCILCVRLAAIYWTISTSWLFRRRMVDVLRMNWVRNWLESKLYYELPYYDEDPIKMEKIRLYKRTTSNTEFKLARGNTSIDTFKLHKQYI